MLVLSSLLLAAAPVGAQTAPAAPAPAPAKPRPICRRVEETGSIMPGRRICLTAAQWHHIGDVRASATDAFLNRPANKLDDATLNGGGTR